MHRVLSPRDPNVHKPKVFDALSLLRHIAVHVEYWIYGLVNGGKLSIRPPDLQTGIQRFGNTVKRVASELKLQLTKHKKCEPFVSLVCYHLIVVFTPVNGAPLSRNRTLHSECILHFFVRQRLSSRAELPANV